MCSSCAMRSARGGCVLNRLEAMSRALSGLTIKRDEAAAGGIGCVLALAGKAELKEQCGEWRKQDHQQHAERAAAAIVVTPAAVAPEDHAPLRHVREPGYCSG